MTSLLDTESTATLPVAAAVVVVATAVAEMSVGNGSKLTVGETLNNVDAG